MIVKDIFCTIFHMGGLAVRLFNCAYFHARWTYGVPNYRKEKAGKVKAKRLANWRQRRKRGGRLNREANPKDRAPIFIAPHLLRQPPGKPWSFFSTPPREEYCDLLEYMKQMEPGPFPPINLAIMTLSQIHDRLLTEIGYYP